MRHVLILEDMYLFQQYLRDIATLAGASSIALVETQPQAIAAASSHRPALIVSDMNLAEGSGAQAVCAILAAHGPIPILYVTGHPERCKLHAPSDKVLVKPVAADVLLRAIKSFLDRPKAPRAALAV